MSVVIPTIDDDAASGAPAGTSVVDLVLASTTLETVATFTPTVPGLFLLSAYLRVVTASTAVTLQVTYTDAGGAQTTVLVNGVSEAVGSSHVSPIPLASVAGAPITVQAQAGTANQVYVSASIRDTASSTQPGASVIEWELADTTLDTVVAFTPTAPGVFLVSAYLRVLTAATPVTVQVVYTDLAGSETTVLVNGVSEAVGSYHVSPIPLTSVAGAPITVQAQAGTANQVFVSASIRGV